MQLIFFINFATLITEHDQVMTVLLRGADSMLVMSDYSSHYAALHLTLCKICLVV